MKKLERTPTPPLGGVVPGSPNSSINNGARGRQSSHLCQNQQGSKSKNWWGGWPISRKWAEFVH